VKSIVPSPSKPWDSGSNRKAENAVLAYKLWSEWSEAPVAAVRCGKLHAGSSSEMPSLSRRWSCDVQNSPPDESVQLTLWVAHFICHHTRIS
jgi:hypothetical protein